MGFKENLLKKVTIDQLVSRVLKSMGSVESGKRLDRGLMRQLLEMGAYSYRRERDLDLYCQNQSDAKQLILVLDNELKIYHSTVADVCLRKSPTIKEMVSIRNAIKILNDKDVVVSSKTDTVERVRRQLIDAIDLSYTENDIEALAEDGRNALKNNYTEGILETLTLFADLLGYRKAPKPHQLAHHEIWGHVDNPLAGEWVLGPLVAFNLMEARLKMLRGPVNSGDDDALETYRQVASGKAKADWEGPEVWDVLRRFVLEQPRPAAALRGTGA
jgi:hypothetical protein